MRKGIIPSKTIRVGPHIVEELRDERRFDAIYLDVRGTSYKVLGIDGPTHLLISTFATTPRRDLNGAIEEVANYVEHRNEFRVYRVVSTTTAAGEFTSLKVRR